jgi:protein-tyrosine phosphatase
MGNICRSPTAEGVFRKLVLEEARDLHLELEIDSAGTHGYHVGDPPDRRAIAAAARRGIDLSGLRARRLVREDFLRFDLLLAMDDQNVEDALELAPPGGADRLRLLLDYAPETGVREVPDPYYGGAAGFERVLDLVEAASRGLIAALRTQRR